jgi:hypothetical protein
VLLDVQLQSRGSDWLVAYSTDVDVIFYRLSEAREQLALLDGDGLEARVGVVF